MSRFFLVVLALFAIADVQVALARLKKNHNVNVPSRAAGHSKIRKAHHTRRHLAEGPFANGDAKEQLKVVEKPHFWENLEDTGLMLGSQKKEEEKEESKGGD